MSTLLTLCITGKLDWNHSRFKLTVSKATSTLGYLITPEIFKKIETIILQCHLNFQDIETGIIKTLNMCMLYQYFLYLLFC